MPKFIQNDEVLVNVKAIKEFTDREEPRKIFWEKYNLMKSQMNDEASIQVISYYGFGGIGKTSLLHKLMEEVNNREPESKIEFLDFEKLVEFNNNLLDVLKVIRQDLKDKWKWEKIKEYLLSIEKMRELLITINKSFWKKDEKASLLKAYIGLLEMQLYIKDGVKLISESVKDVNSKNMDILKKLEKMEKIKDICLAMYQERHFKGIDLLDISFDEINRKADRFLIN